MTSYDVDRLIEALKSIDEKLGRIADALEKSVVKEHGPDLGEVIEKNVVEESEPVVEEWDDERILKQFIHMDSAERGFVWTFHDTVTVAYRSRDLAGVVELQVNNDFLDINRHITYDYINNKVLK